MTSCFTALSRHTSCWLLALLAPVIIPCAKAEFIQPDSATASTEFSGGFDGMAINTINGSGLPGSFTPSDSHGDYASGNHWVSTLGTPTNQFIVWGFSTPQALNTIYIWNHRSTLPVADNAGYDVTLFDLTLFNDSNQVLLTLSDVALTPDLATAQTITFGGTISDVSSVRFDVEATQGSSNYTGLAEVGFNRATPVPEPAAAALLVGAGVLGWAGMLRRRSR